MSHGNARLTFHGRLLFSGIGPAGPRPTSRQRWVSRKCVRTWVDRFASEARQVCTTGPLVRTGRRLGHRSRSSSGSSSSGSVNGGDRSGSVPKSVSPRTVSRVLARNAVPRLDDHSRLAYCEILPDEKGATCAGFLTRGLGYFAVHGITTIEQLMTDNAWAYRWSLREHCAAAGINQIFIRPHCPWQNGKVERLNRTLLNEWAYRQVFLTNDDRTAALAPWIERYKHSTTSQRTRRTPTDQPTATNLMAGYS